jgi:hypothetical protein
MWVSRTEGFDASGAPPTTSVRQLCRARPTALDYKKVLCLRNASGNAKMPPNPRSLVLDAEYHTNMLAADLVAKTFDRNLNTLTVTEGMIKQVAGFSLHETPLIRSDHKE